MVNIGNDWDDVLKDDFSGENYAKIREFLKSEYSAHTIYPSMYDIFNAFKLTPFSKVKVVILGQDPYHGEGQAMGLSFSVPKNKELPPSLKNIYKELKDDLGVNPPDSGDLTAWAKQGVLLLNTVLTVRAGMANSHAGKGWEILTDDVIKKISCGRKNVVFILWGNNARSKKSLIDKSKHLILESAHPSPLSAYNGFFNSKPFSKTNTYLSARGIEPIDWSKSSD
ncbi:MAG TPA: uracil-DNA glycosylase [Clostridiales bacterium]|nr:uracil-DNA glycosylase [Clostridiales bacterium]